MICIDLMILMDSCRVGESGRIGARSSHTWFVLKYLLGYPDVRNYDGSWTEWGEPRPDLGLTLHRCHDDALGSERLRDPLRALRRRLREVVDLPQDPDIAESRI